MDTVTEVHLEHQPVGMAISRDWGVQHVEICHEGTGRTFYFLAGTKCGTSNVQCILQIQVF